MMPILPGANRLKDPMFRRDLDPDSKEPKQPKNLHMDENPKKSFSNLLKSWFSWPRGHKK